MGRRRKGEESENYIFLSYSFFVENFVCEAKNCILFLMRRFFIWIIIFLVVLAMSGGGYYWYIHREQGVTYKTSEESDEFVRFDMEAFDKIQANYWKKAPDADLAELFHLSLAKAASTSPETINLPTKDRTGTAKMIASALEKVTGNAKKDLSLNTLIIALYNLAPAGRSGILSAKQETAFRENVSNIDRSKDLYNELGISRGADISEVNKAYTEQKSTLEKSKTPEDQAKLKEITYAHQVLTKDSSKALYDQNQIEPTVFARNIDGRTLYLYVSKISPTTLQEFGQAIDSASTTPGLDSMIIDFRGNVGGSLDFAQYFLGFFMGQNQYAYDFFHQDEYQAQRTVLSKFPELDRYKEKALLTDNMTQSTAELISAAFKRFKIGGVVGDTTRGWGTVENTFPMETTLDTSDKYSLLLVHSLTLRDDNQPIEGHGIEPDVDIKNSNWKSQLGGYFRLTNIASAVVKTISEPPLK